MVAVARRSILRGAASLPLATILASPSLVRAAAGETERVTITTPSGREVSGALAMPDALPAPTVLLIHEWWGLNDHIKTMATEFAKQGYIALAVDLYGGEVAMAGDRDAAQSLMQGVDAGEATETLNAWTEWLRGHEFATGKVGTVGWCFGGGWSLSASIATPVDATVIYYGRVNQPVEEIAKLQGPVLGHFATRDGWINADMVGGFERALEANGKSAEIHWYVADHAFANPTGERYDEEDAALSWTRTLTFFAEHLKG